MNWKVELLKDTAKALIPGRNFLRAQWRRLHPYEPDAGNNLLALRQGLWIVKHASERTRVAGATVLEIGTGWVPIIPHLWHVAGADRLVLTDVERLLDDRTMLLAKRFVQDHAALVCEQLGLARSDLMRRLEQPLRYTYHVPFEPANVPEGTLDVVYSRAVLEHIPPDVMRRLMLGLKARLRPDGLVCHIVDNSDHWQHRDKSLSPINFLRYPAPLFALTAVNVQNYQNRLRHSDYRRLFGELGLEVLEEHMDVDPRSLEDAKRLPLHKQFAGYAPEDLATLTSYFVCRAR